MNGFANWQRINWLAAAWLGATLLFSQVTARADDLADAQSHFERGVKLYQEGAYDAALTEFERAHQTAPRYEVLFNIAQVHYQLHEYAAALSAFERYLEEGAYEISDDRRA